MRKFSILLLVIGVLFAFLPANSFAQETALKVIAINGTVFVKTYPATTWTELKLGQAVNSKDVITTQLCDVDSKGGKYTDDKGNLCHVCGAVTLELPDKSTVSLKPGSEISIDELVMDNAARKLKVNMVKGELRMIVAKLNTPADFSVKTPNAIYGATGTIFYVKSTASGTSVYVADGSISVINPADGTVHTVVAGMMLTFNSDGTVTGPVPASDTDITNWTACYADAGAEPFTPPAGNNDFNANPPNNTPEGVASGS